MNLQQAQEDIGQAEGTASLQPAVLLNQSIDVTKIIEMKAMFVGHYRSQFDKIRESLEDGFIIFRIQTEYSPHEGHRTMAYMVKLRQ